MPVEGRDEERRDQANAPWRATVQRVADFTAQQVERRDRRDTEPGRGRLRRERRRAEPEGGDRLGVYHERLAAVVAREPDRADAVEHLDHVEEIGSDIEEEPRRCRIETPEP